MSVDIRRMSKADLDAINERARLWRARTQEPAPPVAAAAEPVKTLDELNAIFDQMDLFGSSEEPS
jgi:hypothetical protein